MKTLALAAVALSALAHTAIAQTTTPSAVPPPAAPTATAPPASTGPGNSAIKDPTAPAKSGAPVAGANSFTEGQAQARIEARGFSAVSNLKKDDAGVWRATATKDGKQQSVSVDFQGNVVAR